MVKVLEQNNSRAKSSLLIELQNFPHSTIWISVNYDQCNLFFPQQKIFSRATYTERHIKY